MEIVRISFDIDCGIHELDEKLFDDRLAERMDMYLEQGEYHNDYENKMLLESKSNICQFLDTVSGDKSFMGLYYRNDRNKMAMLGISE